MAKVSYETWMTNWNRVSRPAIALLAFGMALGPAGLSPLHAQTATKILPERKPTVPERASSATPAPQLPSKIARDTSPPSTSILPERKPPVPERTKSSVVAGGQPSAPARLGARSAPQHLSNRDKDLLAAALKDAGASRWSSAFETIERSKNPVLRDIIEWVAMRTPGAKLDFSERVAFIDHHPQWPSINELKRITENIAIKSGSANERMAWFSRNPPATTDGKVAYADAAMSLGNIDLAKTLIRDTWISGSFDASEERDFLSTFGEHITQKDHEARLEELLYAENRQAADRMLKRVSPPKAAVAAVRMALIAEAGNVESLIAKLPPDLQNDPGLIYDRIKWRRSRDKLDDARALLPTTPDRAPRPDLWWKERAILARDALENGDAKSAYQITINHGALDAVSVSEAEWFAGWVALRFLKNAEAALQHFQKVYDTVELAANVSRSAYWTGRAAQDLGRADIAAEWYRKAAVHITTFYGQLAVGRLTDQTLPQLPQDQIPTPQERTAFEAKDLTQAVRALADVKDAPYLRSFVLALANSSDFAVDRHMAAELAAQLGRTDLGVWVARQAGRDRIIIMTHGYPIPAFNFPATPEKALQLAIMRQESNFDTNAESPVGASGLMQLMPATAKLVSKKLNIAYNKGKLTSDPSYNVRLGSQYLSDLVDNFDGSYIMAAAGYNAGPGRPRQWAQRFGDPRSPDVDAIDWIESIPFPETRNYVQRVMENVMVYRALLNNTLNVPQTLEKDLKGFRVSQNSDTQPPTQTAGP
jgi:soluble lytic murein transglycosylase